MSGLLGQIVNSFLGSDKDVGSLIGTVQEILQQNGGIQGLIQRFNNAGYGEHVQSWLNGDRLPLTGNQVSDVFSSDEIQRWASQVGIEPDNLKTLLAEAIPAAIDHLTPNGQVPQEGQGFDFSAIVKRFLGS